MAGRKRGPISKDEQISRALSYILRHGAEKEGIPMRKDGYVNIEDILRNKSFNDVTQEDIKRVVANCQKQRFNIEIFNEVLHVRANQGHSLTQVEVEMTKISDPNTIDQCIHGTNYEAWNLIKNQGLSKMNRQHIHMAVDLPGSNQVISGMRSNCTIAIYVDIHKAMKDGIEFFRSKNNVILCNGNQEGLIRPKYFLKVVDLKKNIELNDYNSSD